MLLTPSHLPLISISIVLLLCGCRLAPQAELVRTKLALASADYDRQQMARELVRLRRALDAAQRESTQTREAARRSAMWRRRHSPRKRAAGDREHTVDDAGETPSGRRQSALRRMFRGRGRTSSSGDVPRRGRKAAVESRARPPTDVSRGSASSSKGAAHESPRDPPRMRASTTGSASTIVGLDIGAVEDGGVQGMGGTRSALARRSPSPAPVDGEFSAPARRSGHTPRARRALRHILRCPTTASPLGDPLIVAEVATFLEIEELAALSATCRGWRRLLLREDRIVWKKLAREAAVPHARRSWFWRLHLLGQMTKQETRGTADGAQFPALGGGATALNSLDVVGYAAMATPGSPEGISLQSARTRVFEAYCAAAESAERATAAVSRWKSHLRDLSTTKGRMETMLQRATVSEAGSLSAQDTAVWTRLQAVEEDLNDRMASAKARAEPLVEAAVNASIRAAACYSDMRAALAVVGGGAAGAGAADTDTTGLFPEPSGEDTTDSSRAVSVDSEDSAWRSQFLQIEADVWRTYREEAAAAAAAAQEAGASPKHRGPSSAGSGQESSDGGGEWTDSDTTGDSSSGGESGASGSRRKSHSRSKSRRHGAAYLDERLTPKMLRLKRVLAAYAAFDRGVGYCQGMNFVCARLLEHVDDVSAFWMLGALLHRPDLDLAALFRVGLHRVGLCFFQLSQLLATHLPALSDHLARESVTPEMYSASWFMTLFGSGDTLPTECVNALWDMFVVDGWKAVFRVVLAVLHLLSPRLVSRDFAATVQLLHTVPADIVGDAGELIRLARQFKVTNRALCAMELQYERSMAALLEGPGGTQSDLAASAGAHDAAATAPEPTVPPTSTSSDRSDEDDVSRTGVASVATSPCTDGDSTDDDRGAESGVRERSNTPRRRITAFFARRSASG